MFNDTTNISIIDGIGHKWVFETNGDRPDLIGHEYYIKNVKAILLDNGYCEMDIHYAGVPGYKRKEPIPKTSEVEINYYHINFYGVYFNIKYNNKNYDIPTKYIKLVKKE